MWAVIQVFLFATFVVASQGSIPFDELASASVTAIVAASDNDCSSLISQLYVTCLKASIQHRTPFHLPPSTFCYFLLSATPLSNFHFVYVNSTSLSMHAFELRF
uniref:Secreted protein n=1 Tax=Palpitomonas bilix TaxID=652834 RepID=A0A7S3LSX0_9EUKA|mmetsp:Transcript_43834/g.114331  ORF Transcript_43834/g.114331 Transcript_43834/m.114331 type:complete len:104 (+) Transcript_43834:43-354(+)